MAQKYVPVADKVLIEPMEAPKYSGLLHIPNSDSESNRGKIVGVGPKCTQLQVGDVVIYRPMASFKIEITTTKHFYMTQEADIIAVVKE